MLELKHIVKRYDYMKVLDDISMVLPEVGMIGIVGPSGCGKSTLLNIIGGIDKQFSGELLYNHKSVKKSLSKYRQQHVSFIFQHLHLIMWLSIKENMKLSLFFHKQSVLDQTMDLSEYHHQKISTLSFGQRQRIAYIRAFYQYKDIILCDEPTGSLDPHHALEIMKLLKKESQEKLVIIVSHDLELIQSFCDEIYSMKDGHIVEHTTLHQPITSFPYPKHSKRMLFPSLRLSWKSLMSNKKRTFQMIFGFSLSLICILLTLTMSQNLEYQINQYISSLIPPSSISLKSQNVSFDLDMIKELRKHQVNRIQLFLDDYECLGIGFVEKQYQQSQTLFIADDSSPYSHLLLKYGTFPQEDHDIIVSLSTASHLCGNQDIQKLLGKKIYAWYKHEHRVISIEYDVVGITSQKTTVDTLYQKENAYIRLLKEKEEFSLQSHLGILYVDQDASMEKMIQNYKHDFPQFQFIETGASTRKQVHSVMSQIKMILYIFSTLAILSSLFLIGEVMFFNTLQKKKDYAIMTCFGARLKDFVKLIFFESIEIVIFSLGVVFVFYIQIVYGLNIIVKELLFNQTIVFSIDFMLMGQVAVFSIVIVLLCQIIPMITILKMNTIEALKG